MKRISFIQSCLRYSTSTQKRHVLRQPVNDIKGIQLISVSIQFYLVTITRHFIPVHKYRKPSKGFDNRVYVWGLAETGALGNEKNKDDHKSQHTAVVTAPTRQQFAEQHHVVDMACGYGFSAFVVQEENGTHSVYGTGINTDGQLGLQLSKQSKQMEMLIYPAKIPLENNIKIRSIAAGRAHLAMVTDSNAVLTLGNNSYGQAARKIIKDEDFSLGHQQHKFSIAGETLVDVACGQDHTMLVSKTGRVFSCGWGSDGQTGLGSYGITSKPHLVEGDVKNEKIVKVSSAADCVLALNDKGDVFGWGNSEYGQFNQLAGLGVDDQQIHTPRHLFSAEKYGRIVDIAAGGSFCLILNGELLYSETSATVRSSAAMMDGWMYVVHNYSRC